MYAISPTAFVKIFGTGIQGFEKSFLNIYPNPTNDVVNISSHIPLNLKVMNAHGQVMIEKDKATSVDLSELADGVYLFLLSDHDNTFTLRESVIKRSR